MRPFRKPPPPPLAQHIFNLFALLAGAARRGRRFHVYTDGSFRGGCAGYGAVILWRNGRHLCQHRISGRVGDPSVLRAGSVGVEFHAVMEAVSFCERKGAASVVVHHDCMAIADWPFRAHRRRKPILRRYESFMRERLSLSWLRRGGAPIRFRKVRAHSGDRFNSAADRLAGQAAAA